MVAKKNKRIPLAKPRDPVKTKAKILTESIRLFASKGYEGTPISAIVKAAQVNKRMIYHYFGDKAGLYRAIFVELWGQYKDWMDQLYREHLRKKGSVPQDAKQLLLMAMEVMCDILSQHSNYVRLLLWEVLEGGMISRSIWTELRGPLFAQTEFLIKQAQSRGELDAKLDPAHIIVSLLGAAFFYYAYAPTLEDMLGKHPLSAAALKERKKQMELLLNNLFKS